MEMEQLNEGIFPMNPEVPYQLSFHSVELTLEERNPQPAI